MKYRGRTIKGPREKIVPILRDESQGGNIYLKVKGIIDFTPFFSLCPEPQPPKVKRPEAKGGDTFDFNDKFYRAEIAAWSSKKTAWTILESLKDNEIEWETIDMTDPNTWQNYQKEFIEADFVDAEMARIINAVFDVNGLNEALVEEARQSFLAMQQAQLNGQSSQRAEARTTSSGEPAKESESNLQDTKI